MKVLAIFTCYNRRELTRQSMELLGQNKNVTFDYVIVNDGSTDGTDEMLAAMPYEIDLINGDGGLFWNRGMYEAIEHAKKAHPDCAIIPHDIFMKVSIDPFYQHSIGDFDYGLAISRMGYEIRIFPKFIGQCNDGSLKGTWQDESLPRMQRMKLKESRKGLPFRDWFHFLHKYFGLGTAIVRSITPYVRIILGTKTRYSGA